MSVIINGTNTPTAGGVTYGNGTEYATTSAGTSGQVLISAGASAPTWGTASAATTATNLAGGSAGTVPYQSASGTTAMLSAGTSGQVLTSSGAGAPSWTTPSSGAMVLLSTINAAGSATVDVETGFSSTYDNYVIYGNTVYGSSGSQQLKCFFKMTGAYATGTYLSNVDLQDLSGTTASLLATSAAYGTITNTASVPSSAARSFNFKFEVYGVNNATSFKFSKHWSTNTGANTDSSGTIAYTAGGGVLSGIRFQLSSGNITGTFYLFGIKNT